MSASVLTMITWLLAATPFIPISLHPVDKNQWTAQLTPHTPQVSLSDFIILIDFPTSKPSHYTLSLRRENVILLQKNIRTGSHTTPLYALTIPIFLTLANSDIKLHIQTTANAPRAPFALLVPKDDALLKQNQKSTTFPPPRHLSRGLLQPLLKRLHLSPTLLFLFLAFIAFIVIIRIKFLFYLKKHFNNR